jgi:hypothetical protein
MIPRSMDGPMGYRVWVSRHQRPALRHGNGIDPCQHPGTPRPSMAAQCIRHHAVDTARRCRRGTGIRSIPQVKYHQTPHSLAVPAGLNALRSDPQHAGGTAVTADRAVHCHARGTPSVCRYFRGGVKMRGVVRPGRASRIRNLLFPQDKLQNARSGG